MSLKGFPHSEIPGSKLVCSSPGLIAAYRVLHRLLAPRHSPYALSSLTIRNSELTPTQTCIYVRVRSMHTACVWSVKLPFAEYSIVKERAISRPQKLVENTGLEPVTSWLQTR